MPGLWAVVLVLVAQVDVQTWGPCYSVEVLLETDGEPSDVCDGAVLEHQKYRWPTELLLLPHEGMQRLLLYDLRDKPGKKGRSTRVGTATGRCLDGHRAMVSQTEHVMALTIPLLSDELRKWIVDHPCTGGRSLSLKMKPGLCECEIFSSSEEKERKLIRCTNGIPLLEAGEDHGAADIVQWLQTPPALAGESRHANAISVKRCCWIPVIESK